MERIDLRVLLTSTSYPATPSDWPGRFIADMVAALAAEDNLELSVWAPPGVLPLGVADIARPEESVWLAAMAAQGGIAHLLRQRRLAGLVMAAGLLRRLRSTYQRCQSDVVHVNWLQNALPLWGTRLPALITVLGSDLALLSIPGMVKALRAVLKQRRAILAPNAEWMLPRLASAFGDVAEIRPIPFGVDARWFAVERQAASCVPWLVVTRLTTAKLGDLFAWGDGLFDAQRPLHLFGPMQERIELPSWIHWHGATHPADLAEVWFPQAAGLISLSRHDEGRPQVLLDAMAAGLPVVVSDLPAHSDFVADGLTGYVVGSRKRLAEVLSILDDPVVNLEIGRAARSWVKTEIGDWSDCAKRYHAAYLDLLE